ncbi:MAG: hypothetical protein RJB42_1678 [Bacteroidota bacterium]|jgi:hypothetical protein
MAPIYQEIIEKCFEKNLVESALGQSVKIKISEIERVEYDKNPDDPTVGTIVATRRVVRLKVKNKTVFIVFHGFQEAVEDLPNYLLSRIQADSIVTSPPYFNSELYAENASDITKAKQSHERYTKPEAWRDQFAPLFVLQCLSALSPKGIFSIFSSDNRYLAVPKAFRQAVDQVNRMHLVQILSKFKKGSMEI